MRNKRMNKMLKKSFPTGFNKMKDTLGEVGYDALYLISIILLFDSMVFIKKIGVLEEFLEDKNEISHLLINTILESVQKK